VAIILAAGLLTTILPAPILSARADSSANSHLAESYIAEFFRATVETAVAPQSDEYATKAVKIRLLREIQLDETARFMLGRAWPTDNKEAGRRFQEEFKDFVAEVVTRSLRGNPNLALVVKGSRMRADDTTLVSTMLSLPSGSMVPVDWRLAQNPRTGAFQIADITIVGLDAAILLRTMAEATLAETDIGGLIPRWRAALIQREQISVDRNAERPTVTSP
jgi:ABC-type transporter MlaC component